MHMPPPVHGAAMMGKCIHDSVLINNNFECQYVNIATANNLDDLGRGGLRKIWMFINMLKSTRKIVDKFHPDIAYLTPAAFGMSFYKDFIMAQLLKQWCGRVVYHYHNKGVAQHCHGWINRLLYHRFFSGANVILLSDLLYPDIASFVPKDEVMICPNGIPDIDKFPKHTPISKLRILFLSNLIRSKGLYTLLDALSMMKDKTIHCHIAGAPGDVSVEQLQVEIQNRNLQTIVTYHGFVNAEQKSHLLKQTDVFVFPTERDCFPLVLLEAMRSGIPCVTTNEGAISDIVDDGQTGWIIEKRNPKMLADKIEWLLNHPQERMEMGSAGREKYERCYTLECFEKRMAAILSQCEASPQLS